MNRNIDSENDDTTGHIATNGPVDEADERRRGDEDTEGHRRASCLEEGPQTDVDTDTDTEGHLRRR
ncbi:hypothetical protein BH23ACT3_BH23ACT3_22130 [soil metagenome]